MAMLTRLAGLIFAALLLTTLHQPIAAAPRITPIVGGGFLLGGSVNGKWIDAATTARQLRGNQRYRIYTTAGQIGTSTGKAKAVEVICPDMWQVEFKPYPSAAEFVAVGGTHNPLPRKPRLHSPNTAVYRQAVADILRAHGIANPDVRITKIVRIDLEGDGVDEVVISATRFSSQLPSASAGDYSLVVLRKIINGKVQTIPIDENYYPKAEDFIAPNTFSVPAIVDANGDGTMEIMVNWGYYEGSGAELYSVQGSKVTGVLSGGCGV
ncbi:MAG TPA: hypothetical protein VFZ66_04395 [Herpetosiphonaceae bacterium]